MKTVKIQSHEREEFIDITALVQKEITESGVQNGTVICFVPHTTAALTINENTDPDVRRDLIYKLNKEIPQSDGYRHAEGNSDAHLKSSLMGFSETLLFQNGRLVLGTWQAIYFCEFDGPRNRKVIINLITND